MQCPDCHGELLDDPGKPGKLLCYECRKRYDRAQLEYYYGERFRNVELIDQDPAPSTNTKQMEPVKSSPKDDPDEPSLKETMATTFSIAPVIVGLASVVLVWMPEFSNAGAILGLLAAVLGGIGISMHIKNSAPAISVALGLFAMVVFGIMVLIRIPVEFVEQSGIGEDVNMVYHDTKNTYNDIRNVYSEAKNTTTNVYHDAQNTYEDARNAYDGGEKRSRRRNGRNRAARANARSRKSGRAGLVMGRYQEHGTRKHRVSKTALRRRQALLRSSIIGKTHG